MPVVVGPGMAPVPVPNPTPNPNGSSKVKFLVEMPTVQVTVTLLITLCIRIRIGSLTVSIYYSRIRVLDPTNTQAEQFDTLLPNGSEILGATATFDELYPEIG